tara:strand:+ start:1418 stop:1579 length:162 start_codon:yes stop_codon:yes gene_type:complete
MRYAFDQCHRTLRYAAYCLAFDLNVEPHWLRIRLGDYLSNRRGSKDIDLYLVA